MGKTSYYSMDGMIFAESTNGVMRNYGTDALGSVVETIVNGAVENTYQYKPFGGLLAKTGTAPDPSFLWNGGSGYRAGGLPNCNYYVRARHYDSVSCQWISIDKLWPRERQYIYAGINPVKYVDASGDGGVGGSCQLDFVHSSTSGLCNLSRVTRNPYSFCIQQYSTMNAFALVGWGKKDPPCSCGWKQCFRVSVTTTYKSGNPTVTTVLGEGPCALSGYKGWVKDKAINCLTRLGDDSEAMEAYDAPGWSLGNMPVDCPKNESYLRCQPQTWDSKMVSLTLQMSFVTYLSCTQATQILGNPKEQIMYLFEWGFTASITWPDLSSDPKCSFTPYS